MTTAINPASSETRLRPRGLLAKLVTYAASMAFYYVFFRLAEWLVRRFSSVGREAFFDSSKFTWIPRVEGAWTTIREELYMRLHERAQIPHLHELAQGEAYLGQDDKWKTYWLYAYGQKIEDNCRRCPETTRIIETIPGMKTAFFSILAPDKHIPPHRGTYAGVLRCHLGLIVPGRKEDCRMRVGSEFTHWEEGKSLVFDDTYDHEVWIDTDKERVVLLIDFARPLPFPVSVLNELMIRLFARSGLVQEILGNLEKGNRTSGAV